MKISRHPEGARRVYKYLSKTTGRKLIATVRTTLQQMQLDLNPTVLGSLIVSVFSSINGTELNWVFYTSKN